MFTSSQVCVLLTGLFDESWFDNLTTSNKNIIHLYIWKLIDKPTNITNKSWDVLATCRREHLHQESVRFANAKTFYTHHKSCTGTCSLCKGITASQTYAYTIVRTMQQCMLRCVWFLCQVRLASTGGSSLPVTWSSPHFYLKHNTTQDYGSAKRVGV